MGYTPELAVAVWVGYPNELRPMETEFNGGPVAGGTLPALIWKAFMTRARRACPTSFTPPPYLPSYDARVVFRGGKWRLDNGFCPATRVIRYFAGRLPESTATCYANEVSVPVVVGRSVESARVALRSVPLAADVVYVPAKPRTRPGEVMKNAARRLPLRERDGAPLGLRRAGRPRTQPDRLEPARRAGAEPEAEAQAEGPVRRRPAGTVVKQSLEAGVAVKPGLPLTLLVGRGSTS